jgi:hypothetical protein
MWRHALDLLAPCSERPQRPRIDTERHRLAAAQPAAEVCPVIDRARSQYLGIARHEGAPDCPLCRPAADGSTDTMTRCERIGQAHGFARSDQCHLLGTCGPRRARCGCCPHACSQNRRLSALLGRSPSGSIKQLVPRFLKNIIRFVEFVQQLIG